ncbi:MAG: UDP-N-acetylmuramoyl-tripeptide--D-alanyl-D-alanine ligase [Eubacterium sp.]|nr:UDP-N-acetylmuramoyl-tripeptide--D-alanyl-D-alanine ligase [Eubacterium sp.]
MKPLSLKEIIESTGASCAFDGDLTVTGVSSDTRTIQKGDLFVALVGERFDGNDYVNVAAESGAVAALCSKPVEADIPVLLVDDTLNALHRLAEYYRTLLDIRVVAVTGSNGKTTTRDMTKAVLASAYKVYSTEKNYNNEIGLPKTILQTDGDFDIAVLEVGMNHLGEISRLTKIGKPDVALITNIGKAHIGNLGSQDNILKAKLEILEGLNPDGLVIFNGDDAYLRKADANGFRKAFVGINGEAELKAEDIEVKDGKTYYTAVYDGKKYRGSIPVIGNYNVLNSLEAMRCGIEFGIMPDEAFKALADYQSVGMRCEAETVGGVTLVKDYYNASPDSSRVALEALGDYTQGGKKTALLGEMLELGDYSAAEHKALGEMCVKNGVELALFIGDDCASFKEGMPSATVFAKAEREAYAEKIKSLVTEGRISKGDAVLIKASRGTKMEDFYEVIKAALQ